MAALAGGAQSAQSTERFERERARMVDEIAVMARETGRETGRPAFAARVIAAMRKVDRHELVAPADRASAYANRPLGIGHGQTISQPYIVALMTDLVDPKPGDRVLEIGTGSGYQAAVLAELVAKVYTIEIVAPLAHEAARRLERLGYRNLVTRIGDGYAGWPEEAPFDSIVVTAAAPYVPAALVAQLKARGRMVIPVGTPSGDQELFLIEKAADGTVTTTRKLSVRFVPLTRSP